MGKKGSDNNWRRSKNAEKVTSQVNWDNISCACGCDSEMLVFMLYNVFFLGELYLARPSKRVVPGHKYEQ
jgi:hypothetical protein